MLGGIKIVLFQLFGGIGLNMIGKMATDDVALIFVALLAIAQYVALLIWAIKGKTGESLNDETA